MFYWKVKFDSMSEVMFVFLPHNTSLKSELFGLWTGISTQFKDSSFLFFAVCRHFSMCRNHHKLFCTLISYFIFGSVALPLFAASPLPVTLEFTLYEFVSSILKCGFLFICLYTWWWVALLISYYFTCLICALDVYTLKFKLEELKSQVSGNFHAFLVIIAQYYIFWWVYNVKISVDANSCSLLAQSTLLQ